MKHVDEYRDGAAARRYADAIAQMVTRPWSIMEICGGQTHAIVQHGIDRMLPEEITLLHGPGCPVCVTPAEAIDAAVEIALRPAVILCSFGDMLRVPGSQRSLLWAKSQGGDVRMVYSPLDAVAIARDNPEREVLFLAIGFETTTPTTAMAVLHAERAGLKNFSMLVSHVLVPPAMSALLDDPQCKPDGFLAAGHVCAITGAREYEAVTKRYRIPVVITGFEPLDLLQGLHMCIRQLEAGEAVLENQYSRSVREEGNRAAQSAVGSVFQVTSQDWRGIGTIPGSGLRFAARYAAFDARARFPDLAPTPAPPSPCISGEILRGARKPPDCPAFGGTCTPEHPLGATMVSSEGACAAYYRYRKPAGVPKIEEARHEEVPR